MAPFSSSPLASLIFSSIPPSFYHILFFRGAGLKWCKVFIWSVPCPYCLNLLLSPSLITPLLSLSLLSLFLSPLPSSTELPFQIPNNLPFLTAPSTLRHPSFSPSHTFLSPSLSPHCLVISLPFLLAPFVCFPVVSHRHPYTYSPFLSLSLSPFTFFASFAPKFPS